MARQNRASNALVVRRCISLQNISHKNADSVRIQKSTGAASFVVLDHARDFIPHEFAEHAIHFSGGSGCSPRNKSHVKSQRRWTRDSHLQQQRPARPRRPTRPKLLRHLWRANLPALLTLESGCARGRMSQLGNMKTTLKTPTSTQPPLSHPSHILGHVCAATTTLAAAAASGKDTTARALA